VASPSIPPPAFVITGASTGIGNACALELDRRGFRVFAGVRSESAAQELQAQASARLTPVRIDVTDVASIAAAAEIIAQSVGEAGLAGLVNNAGIAVSGPLEIVPIEALRRQLEVNVIGQVAVTQSLLPLLRKARGRVVNMSSISGGVAAPYLGPYSASKFAMEAITDTLRLELRSFGIHVSAVEPGPIERLAQETSPEILSLYEADLAAMRQAMEQSVRTAAPIDLVVRAVVHALTAKRPKTRYFLGWSVWASFKCLKIVPDRLKDWILRKIIGLS
jgi:NAD(P)-dependent dehydrogenase (short-subunit alcohol dehydrogenase family)